MGPLVLRLILVSIRWMPAGKRNDALLTNWRGADAVLLRLSVMERLASRCPRREQP